MGKNVVDKVPEADSAAENAAAATATPFPAAQTGRRFFQPELGICGPEGIWTRTVQLRNRN